MAFRIEVSPHPELEDPRGAAVLRAARQLLPRPPDAVRVTSVYKLAAAISDAELETITAALTDPVLEVSAQGQLPLGDCDWIVSVGFRPGVTDNVGHTAEVFLCDLLARPPERWPTPPRVYTEMLYRFWGKALCAEDITQLTHQHLANRLIHRIRVLRRDDPMATRVDLELPLAGSEQHPQMEAIPLPQSDEALLALSRTRCLALSLEELRAIAAHYDQATTRAHRQGIGLPLAPTDVELEALAQTWSEHCKHKIFAAEIDYRDAAGEALTIRSLFKTYIVGATQTVAERVDWLVSVFEDNAGVVRLDPKTHLVYKVETHNSPSALDPYGGAITGIVGVNRDPFGTGIGASLLTNTWGYCLGPPDEDITVPDGLHHPRRIRDGVHRGVIDGGNQSGIPYSRGFECFDERYVGKPLVFCGTVGVMPAHVGGQPSERKEIRAGDAVVMVGGRIGKDGIHGATFSSEALHSESPAQAVQIGDPITQKKMTDMLLEARDLGLYRTLTDNGAGGLSSSVGELARLSGGAALHLDRAPLKYTGLAPWEILLSEAQERMTLAVPPENLDALLALAQRREVEATPIGTFTDDGRFRLYHDGAIVGDLDLAFLHDGCPTLKLSAHFDPPHYAEPSDAGLDLDQLNIAALLADMAGRLNLCARTEKARQYDHEVKGLSVIKPLVGVFADVPADATVMRVRHGDDQAILLSEGILPRFSDLDPGEMAAAVVDLALRRQIAAGGMLGRIAGLDNFCWPDPVSGPDNTDGAQKLAGLVRACRRLAEMTIALDLPLISGKDSMKNDSVRGGVKISIPPTLLFSALGWVPRAAACIDLCLPRPDIWLYLLGETDGALGGSELYAALAETTQTPLLKGNDLPRTDAQKTRAVCQAAQEVIASGCVCAAHAPHLGGLGTAFSTLCLAADLGLEIDLAAVPTTGALSPLRTLFAETPGRILLGVAAEDRNRCEQLLRTHPIAWAAIGRASAAAELHLQRAGQTIARCPVATLRQRYTERLDGR